MPRVICTLCNETGYTAAPEVVRCECGGKLEVLPNDSEKDKAKNKKDNIKEECLVSR